MTTADAGPTSDMDCLGATVAYRWRGTTYEVFVDRDDDGFYSYRVYRIVTDGAELKARDVLASRPTRVEVHSTEAVFHDVDGALSDARQAIADAGQDDEPPEA